jgi:hypothetical protein
MGRYLALIRAKGSAHSIRCDFSVVGYINVDAVYDKSLNKNEFGESFLFSFFSFFLLVIYIRVKIVK